MEAEMRKKIFSNVKPVGPEQKDKNPFLREQKYEFLIQKLRFDETRQPQKRTERALSFEIT